MALKVCNDRHCTELTDQPRCPKHTRDPRPSAAARGYNQRWRHIARAFLAANPRCKDCGAKATVPDHSPRSRRQLVALGVTNPDDFKYLEPRCKRCHNKRTARMSS